VLDEREPNTALVLAGGGALGAYEAGALSYILDALPSEVGRELRFNMFAGTSVGALNATLLAEGATDQVAAARATVEYWRSITFERVLSFSRRELVVLARLLLGQGRGQLLLRRRLPRPPDAPHPPVAGLFDTSRLFQQMVERISPDRLRDAFASRALRGLALCATEVCTGRAVVFYETADGVEYRLGRDPARHARRVEIGAAHAMASAALPFLFPAVQVDGICYTDGALRQNTPLNPALRMGAERVMVISVTQDPAVAARSARLGCRRNPYPGALFLLGRMVNVLLAQSLDHELNRVEMYNRLIAGGVEAYGPDFIRTLNGILSGLRNAEYRPVRTFHLRPSRDLNRLALQALREAPDELEAAGLGGRFVGWVLGSAAVAESELLALLLFTPTFIRRLLELGYHDARSRREELLRFFEESPVERRVAAV